MVQTQLNCSNLIDFIVILTSLVKWIFPIHELRNKMIYIHPQKSSCILYSERQLLYRISQQRVGRESERAENR